MAPMIRATTKTRYPCEVADLGGRGEGAAMLQPLAIGIVAGLVLRAPLVLLVLPVVFALCSRGRRIL